MRTPSRTMHWRVRELMWGRARLDHRTASLASRGGRTLSVPNLAQSVAAVAAAGRDAVPGSGRCCPYLTSRVLVCGNGALICRLLPWSTFVLSRDLCVDPGVFLALGLGMEMIGKDYLVRLATVLMRMARVSHNPAVSGSTAAKAADLKTELDDRLAEQGP
jgi:hypothetical protein